MSQLSSRVVSYVVVRVIYHYRCNPDNSTATTMKNLIALAVLLASCDTGALDGPDIGAGGCLVCGTFRGYSPVSDATDPPMDHSGSWSGEALTIGSIPLRLTVVLTQDRDPDERANALGGSYTCTRVGMETGGTVDGEVSASGSNNYLSLQLESYDSTCTESLRLYARRGNHQGTIEVTSIVGEDCSGSYPSGENWLGGGQLLLSRS